MGKTRLALRIAADLGRAFPAGLYSLGMMLLNQGYAALRSGTPGDAEAWLTEGLRIAGQIDDRVAVCYLVGALGCCAARTATAALGATAFDAACHAGRQLSRDAAVRLALHQTTAPAPAPAAQASPGILSQRETEVARLVAEGRSNRDIGTRLFVSERTVESHVRNILTKLGFTTRSQVAGWMIETSNSGGPDPRRT